MVVSLIIICWTNGATDYCSLDIEEHRLFSVSCFPGFVGPANYLVAEPLDPCPGPGSIKTSDV